MAAFTEAEVAYLTGERHLGRFATVDPDGTPHVVPVGWRYDPEEDAIEVSGRNFARTHKFRNAKANPHVAIVIDDVLPPWRPRSVMVQGIAEAIEQDGNASLRIRPRKVVSWGLSQ